MIKPSQPGFRPWENRPTSLRSRKCIPPLVAGATTFPPQFGGAAKGKRLNGQARRLTSPHLEVLCRTSTGALWVLSHGAMSLQESIETYSSPLTGGSPAQPG